jgi:type IV fimbrial biogenesis protein FimT
MLALGFTLVELLITLAVVSTLLAIGAPQFSTMLANSRVRSAAESVQHGLRLAQVEALKRSASTEWTLTSADPVPGNAGAASSASARNWISRVRIDATRGLNAFQFLAGSEANPVTAPTITNQAGNFPVVFMPTGQVMRGDAGGPTALAAPMAIRVNVAGADRPLCVLATPSGSIKMCDPALAAGDPRACRPAITAAACPAN